MMCAYMYMYAIHVCFHVGYGWSSKTSKSVLYLVILGQAMPAATRTQALTSHQCTCMRRHCMMCAPMYAIHVCFHVGLWLVI